MIIHFFHKFYWNLISLQNVLHILLYEVKNIGILEILNAKEFIYANLYGSRLLISTEYIGKITINKLLKWNCVHYWINRVLWILTKFWNALLPPVPWLFPLIFPFMLDRKLPNKYVGQARVWRRQHQHKQKTDSVNIIDYNQYIWWYLLWFFVSKFWFS